MSLRPLTAEDLDDVHAYYSRPEVTRYLYWDARDCDESREALERYSRLTVLDQEGDGLILAVVPREVGRVVGQVSLQWCSRKDRHTGRDWARPTVLVPVTASQSLPTSIPDRLPDSR